MERIQKVSQFFLVFFKFLFVFLPLLAIFKWVFMSSAIMHSGFAQHLLIMPFYTPSGSVYLPDIAWSPLTRLIGLSAYLLALIPLLTSLFALIHIFKNYSMAKIFNIDNARYFRLIGWMFILDGILVKSLVDGLMTIAVSLNNPPGERYITLQFDSLNVESIFCGAVVIIVSWVMLEASKIHEEHQYTV